MTTKGLVRLAALALPLVLFSSAIADGLPASEVELTSLLDEVTAAETAQAASECNCDSECWACNPPRTPFWFAGTEFTFMGLNATTGGRVTASFSDTTAPGVSTVSIRDGNGIEDFAFAPRIWLGRQFGERWGIAGRFWTLEATEQNAPASAPGTPPTGTNFATLYEVDRAHLYTIDLEAVRSFRPGKWKIDGTLGARHASISVDSAFTGFGVFTTGNFINMALSNGFSFDGTGATSALFARRQLGNSPASLFLGFRSSYMDGHTDSFGRAVGTVASSPSAPLVGAATVTRSNGESELDIFEYQAGIQWDFALEVVPVNAFFRTSFEYQNWDIDGPPTGGAGFGGTIGQITTNSFSSAGIGAAHLYGLAIATGFTW